MESVVIAEGAEIGNDVFVGPNVSFTAGRYMTGALEAASRLTYIKQPGWKANIGRDLRLLWKMKFVSGPTL